MTENPLGLISRPLLLEGAVHHHLEQIDSSITNQITDDIYVGNLVTWVNNVRETYKLYIEGKKIYEDASMNLQD